MSPLETIMQVAESLLEERKEVEFVLRSGALHRAPGLEQLFIYITTKFFEGTADDLKEYTIAVEAFGRPADFDQKRDAIVRVQARRLRERLTEYYLHGGSDHAIHITIPNGQYAPMFVHNPVRREAVPEAAALIPAVSPAVSRENDRGAGNNVSSQPAANAVRILAGLTHVDHIDGS